MFNEPDLLKQNIKSLIHMKIEPMHHYSLEIRSPSSPRTSKQSHIVRRTVVNGAANKAYMDGGARVSDKDISKYLSI